MESNTFISLKASVQVLHDFSDKIASLLERGLVGFALLWIRSVGQLIKWIDGYVFDKVLIHRHWGTITCIFEALV